MKKYLLMGVVLTGALFASGCQTTDFTTNTVGWSNYSVLGVKDFQAVGIVSVIRKEVIEYSALYIYSKHTGSQVTYASLMDEAKKINADDIINVRIDKQVEKATTPIDFIIGGKKTITYTGTAVAIKYTGTAVDRQRAGVLTEIKVPNEVEPGLIESIGNIGNNVVDGVKDFFSTRINIKNN